MSERRVCRVLGQHRSTQRKVPHGADDEQALTEDIIALAKQYGRYGYCRVTALLCHAGWTVNDIDHRTTKPKHPWATDEVEYPFSRDCVILGAPAGDLVTKSRAGGEGSSALSSSSCLL